MNYFGMFLAIISGWSGAQATAENNRDSTTQIIDNQAINRWRLCRLWCHRVTHRVSCGASRTIAAYLNRAELQNTIFTPIYNAHMLFRDLTGDQ